MVRVCFREDIIYSGPRGNKQAMFISRASRYIFLKTVHYVYLCQQ